ncbi:IS66 family transposase [Pseudomonas aeruginosa]
MSRKIQSDQTVIEQLTYEIALLKRHKFAKRSEQISPAQGSLLDDLLDTDLEAIEAELTQLLPASSQAEPRQPPKRTPLPPQFPRTVIRHEPENTLCACGCQLQRIGEDVSEKLDYTPGVFTVEQHVRGKWACRQCETLIQAPVPAQVIDKGIPTAGLLAHVMVAKLADHLPLYRQEKIFGRAGLAIARSTLAQWVGQTGVRLQPLVDALREAVLKQGVIHADETPVQMLAPGEKKTHRAYVWAYSSTPFSALKAVVYDFSASRAGEHPLQKVLGANRAHVFDLTDSSLARALYVVDTLASDQGYRNVLVVRGESSQGLEVDSESGFALADGALALLCRPTGKAAFRRGALGGDPAQEWLPLSIPLNTDIRQVGDVKGHLNLPAQPGLPEAVRAGFTRLAGDFPQLNWVREEWFGQGRPDGRCLGPFELASQLRAAQRDRLDELLLISFDPFGMVVEGVTLELAGEAHA